MALGEERYGRSADGRLNLWHVGTEIDILVVSGNIGRWIVKTDFAPRHWTCILKEHKRDTQRIRAGMILRAWVWQVDPIGNQVLFSVSDFGKLRISDRMRPRYLTALQTVRHLLSGNIGEWTEGMATLSEFKGMLTRCIERDQWDWLSVYRLFGTPSMFRMKSWRRDIIDLRASITANDKDTAARLQESLVSDGLIWVLRVAEADLVSEATALPNARVFDRSDRRRGTSRTSGREADQGRRLLWPEKLAYAVELHERILSELGGILSRCGHVAEESQHVDLFCRLKTGPAIFEVKTLTPKNEVQQVRQAVGQLYEYRFRYQMVDASLWLVLSNEPKESWIVEYLRRDRKFNVMWWNGLRFSGPDACRLLESGSVARRREEESGKAKIEG